MSDTNVQDVNQDVLVDMFPGIGTQQTAGPQNIKFGMQEVEVDMFGRQTPTSTTEDTTLEPEKPASTTEDTTLEPENKADVLGTATKAAPAAPAFKDWSEYFEDRIKSGKFIAVEEEDSTGKKTTFIPKTPEEIDEVFDLQIGYRLDEAKKEMEKKWYENKTPAWKAISQYAELVDDPTQLIPFLSGVKTLQTVANLNENDTDGAEAIVRTRMEQRGDPEEVITSQIEALKATDKLISTAKQFKPIIIQQEQFSLQQQMAAEQAQKQQYVQLVADIRANALKAIEAPIFGKQKLKNEEKAAIYDLIAEPSEESQGYAIYSAIDSLFDKKDFETLKEIALLLAKKDSFYNYLGATAATNVAASLEKKLRLAGESHKASGNDYDEDTKPVITRNSFNKKPSFGRG